ncbi:MAG: hypothetical protein E4G99_12200 [Anaerolineales bacterium]|nr:MAG: hypothetical protein E4G99_12200 [Anaerolineales bacterium]
MNNRRWIMSALGVLALLVVVWIAASLFLAPAYADEVPLSMEIRSRLLADYNPDDGQSLFTALRLSILGDTFRDQALSPQEAEKQRAALEAALNDPVPTATALDFEGNAPHTATSTITVTPTETLTPTPTFTPTNTPRPTATKTNTPKPTNTPKATNTPVPTDTAPPQINAWSLSPTPGPNLAQCNIQLTVDVIDPSYSEGVSIVEAKHLIPSATPVSYNHFTITGSGIFVSGPGSDWVGTFSGPISLSQVSALESFDVYFKVKDTAGNISGWSGPYSYSMDSLWNCP